jgi:hypothetical protein
LPKKDHPPLYGAGIHLQTLEQIESIAVKPFPADTRRQLVWQRFNLLYANVAAFVPHCEWWLDGSFLTAKSSPDDMDAVLFIEPAVINNLSQQHYDSLSLLLDRPAMKLQYLTDIYVDPANDQRRRDYWRKIFGIGHDSVSAKGIVSVRHG